MSEKLEFLKAMDHGWYEVAIPVSTQYMRLILDPTYPSYLAIVSDRESNTG
eukprot:SAG31_NODE_826_length_11751_cov_4.887659_5_plen_51_part_00